MAANKDFVVKNDLAVNWNGSLVMLTPKRRALRSGLRIAQPAPF